MINGMKNKECNKFQGLVYYAMDRHQEIIAMGSNPDRVYSEAIIKGETCPYVFASYKIINTRLLKLNKIKRLINENKYKETSN